jgi:hypothetical protein
MIRELVLEYDFEGLELDWLRNPAICEPNASQATIDMMTSWVAQIRAVTEDKSRQTSRPFPVGMRIPGQLSMLRSIGLTRRQVLFMILAEAGMMGMIGGALGLVFGIVLTRIFLLSMTAMSGYKITYSIPVQAAVVGFAIAFVVSQLAALMPARRAARLQVLEAIHYE